MKNLITIAIVSLIISSMPAMAQDETSIAPQTIIPGYPVAFVRGDTNKDSKVSLADTVKLIKYLFHGGGMDENCLGAADFNDDGTVNIADFVFGIDYLFNKGEPPPAPFPVKDYDLRQDEKGNFVLGCWDKFIIPTTD